MKGKWIHIVYIVIIGILFFLYNKSNDKSELYEDKIEVLNDSISHSIDKQGNLEAEKRGLEITLSELRGENELLGIDKQELRKEVGKLSNLVSYYKVKASTSGSGSTIVKDTVLVYITSTDTIRQDALTFDYDDGRLSETATVNLITDSVNLDYKYRLSYEMYAYRKRDPKWNLLKSKELYTKVQFDDPNVVVTNLDYIKVEDKKKFFERDIWKYSAGILVGFLITK